MDSEQEHVQEALITRKTSNHESKSLVSFNLDQRKSKARAAYGAFDVEESIRVHDAYVVAPETTEMHGESKAPMWSPCSHAFSVQYHVLDLSC